MRLSSFGRSLLRCHSSRFSFRRALRLFLAARRRWPAGRLSFNGWSLAWVLSDGCCGVLLSGGWPGCVLDALFRWRLSYVAWLLFPSVRRGWDL